MNIITKYIQTLIESLKDNKKIIVICFALYLITAIVAYFMSNHNLTIHASEVTARLAPYANATVEHQSALTLFKNNAFSVVYSYIVGIFFGIFSLFTMLYNAMGLGYQFAITGFLRPNGFLEYLLYVIPHGIFEISGTFFGSVSGLVLFRFIWRLLKDFKQSDANGFNERLLESYQKNRHIFIQSLALLSFAIILMLIAAPIESYISQAFSRAILHY